MRILFVSNFYPPYAIGGYEMHCAEVTNRLRERGHNVRVLTSRHGVGIPTQADGVHRTLFLECDFKHYSPWHFFFRHWTEERSNVRDLSQLLATFTPDMVMFWGMWHLSWALPALAESSRFPVAYYLEDLWPIGIDPHTEYWQGQLTNPFKQVIKGAAAQLAFGFMRLHRYPPQLHFTHAACGSRFLQRKLADSIPAFQNATVVMCGIELKQFQQVQAARLQPDMKPLRLIYVGRLDPLKGVHAAIEALAHLRHLPGAPEATLTVVGSGHPDYETELRRLIVELALSESVALVGSIPTVQIPQLLTKHNCQLVPSVVEEGFGRVLLEGMAAGLVVVATGTGGSGEILEDGVNGLRFPPGDAQALARCLYRLEHEPTLAPRLVHQGRLTAARFSIEAMADGIEQFLLNVVARHRAAGARTA